MKKTIFLSLLLFSTMCSFSQVRIGFGSGEVIDYSSRFKGYIGVPINRAGYVEVGYAFKKSGIFLSSTKASNYLFNIASSEKGEMNMGLYRLMYYFEDISEMEKWAFPWQSGIGGCFAHSEFDFYHHTEKTGNLNEGGLSIYFSTGVQHKWTERLRLGISAYVFMDVMLKSKSQVAAFDVGRQQKYYLSPCLVLNMSYNFRSLK